MFECLTKGSHRTHFKGNELLVKNFSNVGSSLYHYDNTNGIFNNAACIKCNMMKLKFISEMTETLLKRKQCAIKKITKIRKTKKSQRTHL